LALVPFKNAEDIGTDFLNYWRIWELMCPPQSRPSTISYQEQQQLRLGAAQKTLAEASDTQHVLQAAAGLHGLAAKVMAASKLPDFQSFWPD